MIPISTFDHKSVGKGNGQYRSDINLQRRNPVNTKKFSPQLCFFCEEKIQSSSGKKKKFKTINELHGHCRYDHYAEDYKPYLLKMVEDIFHGRLI